MFDLHIANKNYSSWSLRPWVLLKTLDIPFREHLHFFHSGYGQNSAFKSFSPTGLVPALVDDGTTVWDSLAIIEYVAESFPNVWPQDKAARAFARSAASEMHASFSNLRNVCSMNCGLRIELPEVPAGVRRDLDRIEALWGEGLTRFGGPFLAGAHFTAVDAFFCPVALRVQTYGLELGPVARAYVERLLELPAMREWYEAGLKETAREADHEAEARAAGRITADLRVPA